MHSLPRAFFAVLVLAVLGYFGAATIMQRNSQERPRGELIPVPTDWIGTSENAPEGYFRREFILDFKPTQAWLGIAADDYTIWINGRTLARNAYLLNAASPFQHATAKTRQTNRTSGRNLDSAAARSPAIGTSTRCRK